MIAESPDYRGAFTQIEAVERAYQRLRDEGFAESDISLLVTEDCPACLEEHSRSRDSWAERAITGGQACGGLLGFGFGAAMVWWPSPSPSHFNWLELLVQICVVASWLLTGAIIGAMVGALVSEVRPGRKRLPHRHFILTLRPPHGREQEALAILRHSQAALDDEGSTLRT